MADNHNHSGRSALAAGIMVPIWVIGWLFTIGFVGLSFWKGALALIIWPYFLGVAVR